MGYGSTDTPSVVVPYCAPRERWLQDADFVIGRHVKIEVNEGRVMIEQTD